MSTDSRVTTTMPAPARPAARDHWQFFLRTLIVAGVTIGVVILLAGLWFGVHALMLVFAAMLVSIALRGLSDAVACRTGLPPRWAFTVVIVTLVSAFALLGWGLAPTVAQQSGELIDALGRVLTGMQEQVAQTSWGEHLFGTQGDAAKTALPGVVGRLSKLFTSTLGMFGDLVVVLFLSFLLALDGERYYRGLMRLIPHGWRDWSSDYLGEAKDNLRRWLLGRFADMAFVGTTTYIGLLALGVPLPLPLALLTGLLCFIPFFGPILSTVPAALMGLTVSTPTAAYVVVLYLAVQLTEGNVLTPLIEQQAVSIPPAVTLGVVLLLGVWTGPLGMALAVPLTLLVWLIVKRVYLNGETDEPVA
jgi:predicted PurR-regulated permease PerM